MKLKKGNKRYAYLFDRLSDAGVTKDDVIVDCACGGGYGASILRDRGWGVIGFDISSDCIEEAAARGIDVSFSDIRNMQCDDDIADVFICSETLEHLERGREMDSAVSEIKRVCKDNGIICVTVPSDEKKCLKNPNHKTYLSFADVERLFHEWDVIFKGQFCKKPGRCNNVIIFRRLSSG